MRAGARAPDHGRLRPWRFVVLEGAAREKLGEAMARVSLAKFPQSTPEQLDGERRKVLRAPTIIVVAARITQGKLLACAHSGDWRHPVVGLWHVALREDLRRAITVEDLRKIEVWTARHGVALADWPVEPVDPFFNVNTPEDVEMATRLAAAENV